MSPLPTFLLRTLSLLSVVSLLAAGGVEVASATQGEDETVDPQTSHGVELPLWRPGEYRGNFDIRIWPEDTVRWLERENLRAMVDDPQLPEEQKFALKRILALQTAFPAEKAN